MWKRFISILVLLCLSWCAFSESPQSPIQENLTNLEDYVVSIENESLKQNERITNLEEQLDSANQYVLSLENQLEEISKQQEMQSKQSKNLEFKCNVLKVSLGISIGASITSIGILCWALNSK